MCSNHPSTRPAETVGLLADDEDGLRLRVGGPTPVAARPRTRPIGAGRCSALQLLSLLALLVLSQTAPLEASPIRRGGPLRHEALVSRAQRLAGAASRAQGAQRLSIQSLGHRGVSIATTGPLRAGGYWDRYFTRALAERKVHVQGPNALHVLSAYNGKLPDSPFVDYLLWRRSLNPVRFDHYHPGLGRLLEEGNVGVTVDPRPPVVPPGPAVPEPASWLIGSLMAGAGLWVRRARRRQSEPTTVS